MIQLATIWTFSATILKLAGISFMSSISWYLILLPLPILYGATVIILVSISVLLNKPITLSKKK